jgi:hypothetical protein
MVSPGSDDSDLDPVLWVPTCETIKDVDVFTSVEVVDGTLSVDLESVFAGKESRKVIAPQMSVQPHPVVVVAAAVRAPQLTPS